jgi:hypothetical protein
VAGTPSNPCGRAVAGLVGELAKAAERHAEQATGGAEGARSHARWAWEQVKLASDRLAEAKEEHRASDQREQWEWAYAMTTTARELVDTSQELTRIALDAQVAPHYRMATERRYRQVCQRWQETMIKALSRTSATLELQQHVITFSGVHQRLNGHIGVLLRAAETGALPDGDPMATQALHAGDELTAANRHLQRAVSTTLTKPLNPDDAPPHQSVGPATHTSTTSAPLVGSPRHSIDGARRGQLPMNNDSSGRRGDPPPT